MLILSLLLFHLTWHELFNSLALRAGVIIAVSFQKVYNSPYSNTRSNGGYNGLECSYAISKKSHDLRIEHMFCFVMETRIYTDFWTSWSIVFVLFISVIHEIKDDKTYMFSSFQMFDIVYCYLLEGIKNPCILYSRGKMITGSGYATPAWGRWWSLLGRRSSSASFLWRNPHQACPFGSV